MYSPPRSGFVVLFPATPLIEVVVVVVVFRPWDASDRGGTWRGVKETCFEIRAVSKHTGSNPVHGPSVDWAFSLGARVSKRVSFEI
ncbi:hypothetical protein E2C01_001224 [Portunus trituberculatus]|uniref:Uncharacterized protein n=1 Tax=Portunus trituberculatus TaxID=210409 RepID=A0A5B7CM25_PORTR|nr:hypothetical protein [Portunus trituberculatus]